MPAVFQLLRRDRLDNYSDATDWKSRFPVPAVSPKRLLLVDDDFASRRTLSQFLRDAGYDVIEAADGAEGYRRLLADKIGLVVTDWWMPGMDGLEMVRRVRATDLSWYPYILMVTANDDAPSALDAGADDFLIKPIVPSALLPRVRAGERIVALQETLRAKNRQLNETVQQLALLAITDSLTGLLNRREFHVRAEKEWRRATRYGLPLSCVMIDIDQFKRINDTLGHPAGDDVIRRVAGVLKDRFRETDILGRYGGEEYCLLLTNTRIEAAMEMAERFRSLVATLEVTDVSPNLRITVSCGVAGFSLDTLSIDTLIDQADQALLAAKRAGRDRVLCYDDLDLLAEQALADADSSQGHGRMTQEPQPLVPHHVVNTLLTILQYRDASAVEHSQRVARLCTLLGHQLSLDPIARLTLEVAALLHDIGKLATPDRILKKAGALSEEEFAIARQHRRVTVEILNRCLMNRPLVEMVEHSDCWFDGSNGAKAGEEIPLGARVLAIASLYDDMVHGRGWWPQHAPDAALAWIKQASGTQFDPRLVEAFALVVVQLDARHDAADPVVPRLDMPTVSDTGYTAPT